MRYAAVTTSIGIFLAIALGAACSQTPAQPSGTHIETLAATTAGSSGATLTVAPAGSSSTSRSATTTDPTATIVATVPSASEAGPVAGAFTVSLSYYGTDAVTVHYSVGGTATPGADYTSLPGSVTIPAGQTTAVIPVNPIDDSDPEPTETVIASLVTGTGYGVGSPSSATVSIADNDSKTCQCTSVSIQFEPGGDTPAWGAYLVGGNSKWRIGFRINVKCTGTGDSSKCSVVQIEKGTLKWTVGGKSGEIVGRESKVTSQKGKLGDPWEKEYSDALGADYPVNSTDKMSLTLSMEFEIKCVSQDGQSISKRFKVEGSIDAQAAMKGGKPTLSGGSITFTPIG
jgi:hypothetical protein